MILFGIYNLIILIFAVAVNLVTPNAYFVLFFVVMGGGYFIFCIIDAGLIAKRNKANYELAKYNRWFVYIGYFVIAALLIEAFQSTVLIPYFIQSFKMPTGSMEPTLFGGDRFEIGKLIYKTTDPKRGDIIVFKYPAKPEVAYIKRLIGEPGDKVEIIGRIVYINGQPLKEDYVQYMDPGSVYQRYGPVLVPPEKYFVLGDSRDNSMDSRFWGFVPKGNMIGKPLFIYWSYETPRSEYLRASTSDQLNRYIRLLSGGFFTNTRWNRILRVIK
jgi:signal peptidase I